jgi:pimeloyl-ACP methyl ester carboxylesterase
MDLFFLIALGWGDTGGLSIGEAWNVAKTIGDGDAESWVNAFRASGDRQLKQADEWKAAGWTRPAAQARLKAFASYRSGWQFAPVGPVFDDLYARHKAAFREALPDLGLPATFFETPYKGKTLPGVFIQNPNRRAPVVLLLGGADTCFEEIYLTVGRNVFEGGYSVAMADLPGQGITMKDDLHWEAEPEKPIGAIIDVLIERFHARPGRMALLGYSLGGYWACRAACYEKRLATAMASTPLPRPPDLFGSMIEARKELTAQARGRSSATRRNLETMFWKAGASSEEDLLAKMANFIADPALVTMPFLSVVGAGEGAGFQSQSDLWHTQIRSPRKRLVRLDATTGGDAHCQAGNRLRLAQEMCGWMDEIFRT